jgi:PAS domain S-box-containing protein
MQHLSQSRIVVEIPDLAPSNKKSIIRVLHVDDDVCLLEVSKQILSIENNFEIDTVTSVDEAFKKMEQQTYDAVVSDYEMPQKNGLEFLKELREQNNQIPFILFTGKGREEVVVKALNLGADSYINKNGSPETVYCELADAINKTTERKKSKKALAESELKYRTVVEKSLQGILITQTSPLRLVFANESMGKILGYSVEELKSLSPEGVAGLIYHEDRTVFFKRLESRMLGESAPSSLEFRAVRKNGSIVWLDAFANRIEYMGQPAVQGMFLDISERKKADQILKENEARYRELANSLPDIVFEVDLNGKLTFLNQRAFEITGYTREEFEKGLNIFQLATSEDMQSGMENMQKSLAGESHTPTEYTITRKNGTAFTGLYQGISTYFRKQSDRA